MALEQAEATNIKKQAASPAKNGVWGWLKQRLDFSKYIPVPFEGVVIQEFDGKKGKYYIAKSPSAQYLKMEPADFFLWSQMDGQKTVADIVAAYFFQFQSFAFSRIRVLVSNLRQKGFLADSPTYLYSQIQRHYAERNKVKSAGNRFIQSFIQREVSIRGLDGILTRLYKSFVWIFYLPVLIWFYVLLTVAGLGLFTYMLVQGKYALLSAKSGVGQSLAFIYIAIIATAFLHEAAHAFTVKHYGRQVHRGGAMIYMGSLAFYIDTKDIWLAPKKARIAVSWAGPFMNLIIGSILTLIIFFAPVSFFNNLLFQLAFVLFLTALLNLNPLLELDGYFILMDWLEMPSLRKRSLSFLREKLWAKIKAREKFSSDERIFLVFGLFAMAYTVYVLFMAVLVFQKQIFGMLMGMWNSPNILLKLAAVVLGLVFVLPVIYSLLLRLFNLVKKAILWLAGKGFFANARNVAILLLVPAVLIYAIPWRFEPVWKEVLALAFLLLGVAAVVWKGRKEYRSSLQKAVLTLSLPLAVFLALRIIAFLSGLQLIAPPPVLPIALQSIGFLSYTLATYLAFDIDNFRFASKPARLLTALLLLVGVVIGPLVSTGLLNGSLPANTALLAGVVAGMMLFNLSLSIPLLGSFWKTQFRYAWLFFVLAFTLQGGALISGTLLGLSNERGPLFDFIWMLGDSLLFGSILLHSLTRVQIAIQPFTESAGASLNTSKQLTTTVQYLTDLLLLQYRSMLGERRLEMLQHTLNAMCVSARWGISVDRGHLAIYLNLADTSVPNLALIYQQFLDQLTTLLEQETGQELVRQTLRRAYDNLPWENREVLNEYILHNTVWGSWLSSQFKATQQDHISLLSRVPLFLHCSPEELKAISTRVVERNYAAGETIISQGSIGNEFFIVKSGKVAVWQKDAQGWDRLVNEHSRGSTFGEQALLHDTPRNATCIAVTPVSVLFLGRNEFQLVRHFFEIKEKLEISIRNMQILQSIPFFAEIPVEQIKQISSCLKTETFPAQQDIMRQGDPGDKFYVIAEGQIEVYVTRADQQVETIARRGPGEYVGEVALLMDIPRTASVRTLTQATFLTLTREEFLQLIAQSPEMHEGLERVSSRRLHEIRYRSMEEAPSLT